MNLRQRRYPKPKRTTLFLVRVWTDSTGGDEEGASDENVRKECSGSIQRVVDGEARRFRSWQDLINTMQSMLSENNSQEQK